MGNIAPLLEVARNWNEIPIDLEFIRSVVARSAKWGDVPSVVIPICFLNMCSNEVATAAA